MFMEPLVGLISLSAKRVFAYFLFMHHMQIVSCVHKAFASLLNRRAMSVPRLFRLRLQRPKQARAHSGAVPIVASALVPLTGYRLFGLVLEQRTNNVKGFAFGLMFLWRRASICI